MNDMAPFRIGRLMQLLLVVLHLEFVVVLIPLSHIKYLPLLKYNMGSFACPRGIAIISIISRKPIACSKD